MKYDFKEYGKLRVVAADEEFCNSLGDAPKKFQTFVVVWSRLEICHLIYYITITSLIFINIIIENFLLL